MVLDHKDILLKLRDEHDIKVVAFDMDQTAVASHSRGCLKRSNLLEYMKMVTPSFCNIVKDCVELGGFNLAIATHSDEAEFSVERGVVPETHILGHELAKEVLKYSFEETVANKFKIIAFNPKVHKNGTQQDFHHKRFHMRTLCEHYGVDYRNILFFDDVDIIVQDCKTTCGVHAFHVDPLLGFQVVDLENAFEYIISSSNT